MNEPEKFGEAFEWLHDTASAATGLNDFGPHNYVEGLGQLLDALDQDGQVDGERRSLVLGMLAGVLVERLYTELGWSEHPNYRTVRIEQPLVITGIPRTGTTALHKLLALDPQFQGVERWLATTPMPRPARALWSEVPEFQACKSGLEAFLQAMPGFADSHELTADNVDECLEVLKQDFVSNFFPSQLDIPNYREWWYAQSEFASYHRYADVLRLVGLREPNKRWLLKNPGHLWGIDALLEVFPDAMIVQTHRNPATALPSVCRVLEMPRKLYLGAGVQLTAIGPVEADKWRRAIDRMERARSRSPERFYDMSHVEFRNDPIVVIRGIYQRFGLDLSADTEESMRQWLLNQPEEQKQGHNSSPEAYGLTVNGIRDMFADYIEKYSL